MAQYLSKIANLFMAMVNSALSYGKLYANDEQDRDSLMPKDWRGLTGVRLVPQRGEASSVQAAMQSLLPTVSLCQSKIEENTRIEFRPSKRSRWEDVEFAGLRRVVCLSGSTLTSTTILIRKSGRTFCKTDIAFH